MLSVHAQGFNASELEDLLICLQELLLKNSDQLESLSLHARSKVIPKVRLWLPPMPALKYLKISTSPDESEGIAKIDPLMWLSPLSENTLPRLEIVYMYNRSTWNFCELFGSSSFYSVKDHTLQDYCPMSSIQIDWNSIFLNLTRLHCQANQNIFCYIVTKLQKLVHLSLRFSCDTSMSPLENIHTSVWSYKC